MGNMGYCRFENTLRDLQDCYEHIDDELSDSEEKFREKLIDICKTIAEEMDENA